MLTLASGVTAKTLLRLTSTDLLQIGLSSHRIRRPRVFLVDVGVCESESLILFIGSAIASSTGFFRFIALFLTGNKANVRE